MVIFWVILLFVSLKGLLVIGVYAILRLFNKDAPFTGELRRWP